MSSMASSCLVGCFCCTILGSSVVCFFKGSDGLTNCAILSLDDIDIVADLADEDFAPEVPGPQEHQLAA